MLSKPLIIAAFVFQVVGIIWSFVYHVQQRTINVFFEQPNWPIYLGFVLLMVAVLQSRTKKEEPTTDPNKDNQFLP